MKRIIIAVSSIMLLLCSNAFQSFAVDDIQEVTEKEYHLNSSESAQLGMICGGTNRVLFVPVNGR
jgi:hypothetical protein